ncbi:MAG: DUF4290 domain-containing protein [Bacteroidales bacterium]|nr:DUF4290 domain-containing protein [Bacteroidales bacterium]
MDYNTQRMKLPLPEYGRNIQKMVDYIKTIEDKNERTKMAHSVIHIMGNTNPQHRDLTEYKLKLWDHLAIMGNFELDVDSPFPTPTKESLSVKPNKVPYNNKQIRFKHYGKITENIIKKACEIENAEEKSALIKIIANHMKKSFIMWNREVISDDIIFNDLITLSNNKIEIDKNLRLIDSRELAGKIRIKRNPHKK